MIWLDAHSPRTTAIVATALFGGDWLALARALMEAAQEAEVK